MTDGRPLTLREDPAGGLVHLGKMWWDAQSRARTWVPICGLSPGIDTVYWAPANCVSCLTCLVYDRRLV